MFQFFDMFLHDAGTFCLTVFVVTALVLLYVAYKDMK